MDYFSLIVGGVIGFLVRPAHCFYLNYKWHRIAWKKPVLTSIRSSFKDIWS